MSDLIWLSEEQMRRMESYFPLSHGLLRVNDWRIVSGIIFMITSELRWRDAPPSYCRRRSTIGSSARAS